MDVEVVKELLDLTSFLMITPGVISLEFWRALGQAMKQAGRFVSNTLERFRSYASTVSTVFAAVGFHSVCIIFGGAPRFLSVSW